MENSKITKNQPVVLVTGGSGFLGKNIVKELLDTHSPIQPKEIRIFDIVDYMGIPNSRIKYIKGDVRNYMDVKSACKGVDIVIHSAAIIDWGVRPKSEVLSINVGGTENIIKACLENNATKLIYTSSLDAVYTGKPLRNIDESQPYPEKHQTSYCESKYLAEKLVLEANDQKLRTCVLRPSDIYGEEDPYHIGSLIDMAKTGFYIRLGNGKSKCQHVYVGNMAYAHVLLAKALMEDSQAIRGNVYFITDGPGTNFFKFFDKIIIGIGYKFWPKNLWLPKWIAYPMASISEFIALMARPVKSYNPKFSRFAVTYTGTDFTFNSYRAKIDFGFTPKYTEQEAIEKTIQFYKKQS
jgi:sterol-4alpha-carboxylate 3-dehydrogenase (decarboxylating)